MATKKKTPKKAGKKPPPKRMRPYQRGRKWKPLQLDEAKIAKAAEIVRVGNFRQFARQSLGVPSSTWSDWISIGKRQVKAAERGDIDEVGLQGRLVMALEAAEADAHVSILKDVVKSKDPRIMLRFLELRWGRHYNRGQSVAPDESPEDGHDQEIEERLREKLESFIRHDRRDREDADL